MILLANDCLLLRLPNGESVPLRAEMISFDASGNEPALLDADFANEVAAAVFHYFKHDLKLPTITMGELCEAMERVLRSFAPHIKPAAPPPAAAASDVVMEADLGRLADESAGNELLFFARLRDEVRAQLREAPAQLRFCGLRHCVKQLTGARRWGRRCGKLRDQIVAFLRGCLLAETGTGSCPMVVD
jgi:hypothetical protein